MIETYFQLRSNCLLRFEQSDRKGPRPFSTSFLQKKTYSGDLTPHAKKRLLSSLDLLVQKTPTRWIHNPETNSTHQLRLNFITLTIADPTNHTAKETYETCLRPWLRYMGQKMGMKRYVWKAELQQRGQIHYHVATNEFIPWKLVRWAWNKNQHKAGYLDAHAKKFNNFNPNSTDIHAMTNVKDCLNYVAKEILKGCQNQASVKGKVWDCSKDLKIKRFVCLPDTHTWQNIIDAENKGELTRRELKNCSIYQTLEPAKYLSHTLNKAYQVHLT